MGWFNSSGLLTKKSASLIAVGYKRKIKMDEDKNETKKSYMFNGKDFNNWKFRMEILLREHDAENFIIKTLEEHEEIIITNLDDQAARERKCKLKEDLRKKERKCYSLIVQRIANDYLEYVKDKANPKEAWLSLCAAFERKGVSNRMFLRRELLSLKMNDNENLDDHLLKFEKILRNLKSVGAKMEEEDIICQLLLSLPETFESVVTALETMKAEELTMEFVKGRLLDCDIKRKANGVRNVFPEHQKTNKFSEIHQDSAMVVGYKKKHITCYICGKSGHFQNDCPANVNKHPQNHCSCCKNRHHSANQAQQNEREDDEDDRIL